MTLFRWSMRYGAVIQFVATLLIFVVGFASYFFVQGEVVGRALSLSGGTSSKFVIFWSSVAQALGSSVWSFLGACLLWRLDRHWDDGKGDRA